MHPFDIIDSQLEALISHIAPLPHPTRHHTSRRFPSQAEDDHLVHFSYFHIFIFSDTIIPRINTNKYTRTRTLLTSLPQQPHKLTSITTMESLLPTAPTAAVPSTPARARTRPAAMLRPAKADGLTNAFAAPTKNRRAATTFIMTYIFPSKCILSTETSLVAGGQVCVSTLRGLAVWGSVSDSPASSAESAHVVFWGVQRLMFAFWILGIRG